MKTHFLIVPGKAAGERIDKFLSAIFPQYSRGVIQKSIAEKKILVNRQPTAAACRLHGGETIEIQWPPPAPPQLEEIPVKLEIIFEDEQVIVINKPAGLLVHPVGHQAEPTLVHGLLHYNRPVFEPMLDQELRPGIVHRLDRETSGAMVVAKTEQARDRLKQAFSERSVEKVYLTLVQGELPALAGRIENLIGRHPRNRKRMAVVDHHGKLARTSYQVVAVGGGASLLKVRIETGRTHQIRVHFAALNHAVIGDPVYGGRKKIPGIQPLRQMLHAWQLLFPHPESGALREYQAPIPRDFIESMQQLGIKL